MSLTTDATCCRAVLIPLLLTVAWLMAAIAGSQDAALPKPGDVVFETSFDTPEAQQAWSEAPFAEWVEGHEGTTSLKVTVPADQAAGGHMIRMPLDLERYRGCRLAFECVAKAEGVTQPPQTYLGVKFMLHYTSEEAGAYWHNQNGIFGTFDWKKLSFISPIAPDAAGGELNLGLQECSGTAWFDDIKVTVYKGPPPKRPAPPVNPPPAFKGHDLPRLRGVMSPNTFRDEDLRVLGMEWKANVIRWQITRNWGRAGTDRDLADYDAWFTGKLDELDKGLEACGRYGIKVVVDVHWPPGGRYENSDLAIFNEPLYQDHWVAWWEKIARRYKGNPVVWGYDLVNEPVQNAPSPPGVADYLAGQVRAAKAIRAIDPDVPIFIEAAEWDSASGFRELEPVDVPNVVYQVHMYVPGQFTHQGVYNSPTGVVYPGTIGGQMWDKEQLRKVLQPAREFQLAYNVHIYCGEFSAIRWAPGAADYLRDCIELFEEYGWDWTYHAYREWDGWSVEHGPNRDDRQPTAEPTDRKQLLLSWFAKNEKPPAPK
ncbi:MAG: glycoside hydrolase family 5 protein [Armatimonadetes bacterium]|nr:glycoside hydrolase family 5 protein [Armatimonadota bacterium]